MTETEIVHASEVRALVVERILDIREPNRHRDYEIAVSKYRIALRKKPEVIRKTMLMGEPVFYPFTEENAASIKGEIGFNRIRNGAPEWVPRPLKTSPFAFHHMRRYNSGDWSIPARDAGILTDSHVNRDIRYQRVSEYAEAMKAGKWQTLLSDPFAITADGQVVNGQHRIAAVEDVDWGTVDNDPGFLVVWNVDPVEALHADGSRRTDRDEAVIGAKVAAYADK